MKKFAFIIPFLVSIAFISAAQVPQDIVGIYNLRGGLHYIRPNHTFIIVAYATIITGKWELKEKGWVLFTPDYEEQKFTLYGRHNKYLGDSTKIMLSNGFYDDETLLHFGALESQVPQFKRIFKPHHRHISFPYVYTTNANNNNLSFTYFKYYPYDIKPDSSTVSEIYSFKNAEKFNDFIGYYWRERKDHEPFYYQYKNEMLYSDDGESAGEKQDVETVLKETEEGFREMLTDTTSTEFSPKKIYFTPKYNACSISEEDFAAHYIFNYKKNAWLHRNDYVEGEELMNTFDYNNTHIIYEYQKLNDYFITKSAISIDQKPIFTSPFDE
jgi:hypothetical protein